MIKPLHPIDDEGWQLLLADAAKYFNDLVLKRGFQYYKQGRVYRLSTPEPRMIEAVVEGNERYRVEMNLDFFESSQCTCPVDGFCKHMVAVLLDYADIQGRSVHALANARSTQLPNPMRKTPPLFQKTAAVDNKLQELASRIPSASIAEWHELFELCIAPLSSGVRNEDYAWSAVKAIAKIKPPLSPVTESLFKLHAHLFVLLKLTQPAPGASGHFIGYFTQLAISQLEEIIKETLAEKLPMNAEPEQWRLLDETLTLSREGMLKESQVRRYWERCYFGLWVHWIYPNLGDRLRIEEELRLLEAAPVAYGESLARYPWTLAQSWMHFLMENDAEALNLLRTAKYGSSVSPEEMLAFLQVLEETESWPRLVVWLTETGSMTGRARHDFLVRYSALWDSALARLPDAEEQMWSTLARMLPLGESIYTEKLLQYGRWQQWMDYQLSCGMDPLNFRATDLQPLEKNAPEMLLPFYHQAVERYVLLKNRPGYKTAVKLLKRLAKLYKRMKREERWSRFLAAFADRNSRLRALQEEMRKGKLMP